MCGFLYVVVVLQVIALFKRENAVLFGLARASVRVSIPATDEQLAPLRLIESLSVRHRILPFLAGSSVCSFVHLTFFPQKGQ